MTFDLSTAVAFAVLEEAVKMAAAAAKAAAAAAQAAEEMAVEYESW